MLKSIVFFFIDIWLFIRGLWYYFFTNNNDYSIKNISVQYTIDDIKPPVYHSLFWISEAKKWNEPKRITTNVARLCDIGEPPTNVRDIVLFITYRYDNNLYTYVTHDYNMERIPEIDKHMSFNIPILEVKGIKNGDEIDLTSTYVSYAGPKKDFHSEDIECKWLFDVDKIEIKNVIGEVTELDVSISKVIHLP